MTIQRQYNRPNCKLVLEGADDNNHGSAVSGEHSLLSSVTNVECHFAGHDTPLTGGQELLDGLIYAVSRYVQEVLSGITRPETSTTKSVARVQFQSLGEDLHRLTVNQAASESDPRKYQVDLKTIQLFDLVETVDQLVADGQTLPSLGIDLSPLPRRYVATQEPVTEKLLPPALGVSSLAAAAIVLLHFLPVPDISPPEFEPRPTTEEEVPGAESIRTNPSGVGTGDDPPTPPDDGPATTETGSNSDVEVSSNAVPPPQTQPPEISTNSSGVFSASNDPDQGDENTVTETTTNGRPDSQKVEDDNVNVSGTPASVPKGLPKPEEIDQILGTAQPIADPDQLNALTLQLRDRIAQSWTRPKELGDDLIYRVGVAESGDMVGFKPVNDKAKDWVDAIPLTDFDTVPVSAADSFQTSVGQFRVVFRTTGVVEVSPWYGRLPEDE